MALKLSLRSFWILLLVLSSLWVATVFGPYLYSVRTVHSWVLSLVALVRSNRSPRGTEIFMAINASWALISIV